MAPTVEIDEYNDEMETLVSVFEAVAGKSIEKRAGCYIHSYVGMMQFQWCHVQSSQHKLTSMFRRQGSETAIVYSSPCCMNGFYAPLSATWRVGGVVSKVTKRAGSSFDDIDPPRRVR